MSGRIYRTLARRVLLPWALHGVEPTGEALEIGAGTGAMAAALLATFPHLRMVVTDYDHEMVATAQHTVAGFGERASVHQADATDLPFADDRFDLVLSCAMLHHTDPWERAISEAVRVLRPGGRLVGYDVLHTAPLHRGRGLKPKMISAADLDAELRKLAIDVRSRPARGNFAVRFCAIKAA
jgi:ubiquinone/menaquinone biosynthesis C-methylase UbiE